MAMNLLGMDEESTQYWQKKSDLRLTWIVTTLWFGLWKKSLLLFNFWLFLVVFSLSFYVIVKKWEEAILFNSSLLCFIWCCYQEIE
jgi:hypothetical protein